MIRKLATIAATAIAALAALASWRTRLTQPGPAYTLGRNNTVLFLATSLHGLSNVHLAASLALAENHPDITVHFSSASHRESAVKRVSAAAQRKNPAARPIVWHELGGIDFGTLLAERYTSMASIPGPPGVAGITKLIEDMVFFLTPWQADDHWQMICIIKDLVEKIDPAVVVIDGFLQPAMDYLRDAHRFHVLLAPNALSDMIVTRQPRGEVFWKYPSFGSGLRFPLPWRSVTTNIYLRLRLYVGFHWSQRIVVLRRFLSAKGLVKSVDFTDIHRDDIPWLAGCMPEADLPLSSMPPNVTSCGPVAIDAATAGEQDPEMAAWLARAPTLLVNLGSAVVYTESAAKIMCEALATVLDKTKVQVVWKLQTTKDYDTQDALQLAEKYIQNGRLRIENWLAVDPMSLLNTGHIVVSVHHGGANCYNEAIQAGVPHVILPQWIDHYNFAQTAEYLGIGIWASKETAPLWRAEALSQAFLASLQGDKSEEMKMKAKALAKVAHEYGGRDCAAREIAYWAGRGN